MDFLKNKFPVAIAGLNVIFAIFCVIQTVRDDELRRNISYLRFLGAFLISMGLAVAAYRKRSVVLSGAIFGFSFSFSMFITNITIGISLLLCYFCTNKATRYKDDIKEKFEAEFKKGGQRDWTQVVSNLGVANLFTLSQYCLFGVGEFQIDFQHHSDILSYADQVTHGRSWLLIGALASIACALGDTLSSELGPALSPDQEPLLILNMQPVPKGTNGGVTISGLLAALFGGTVIGTGAFVLQLLFGALEPGITSGFVDHWISPQWPLIMFCLYGGLFGSIVDSILGALFQYTAYDRFKRKIVETPPTICDNDDGDAAANRLDKNGRPVIVHISGKNYLSNHDVNCLAILITGLVTPVFASLFWPSGVELSTIQSH